MITATTIPLILLSLFLWRWTKGDLLSMVLFLSIFEAASGLNVGAMGIAPWILVLVTGLFLKLMKGVGAPQFMAGINLTAVRWLFAFVCYAVCSGLIYPFLFEGVPVLSSHGDMLNAAPLVWGMANVAQLCYLLAAVSLFVVAACSSREIVHSALRWYVRGCVTASFLAFYQLANAITHIPYPNAVLYSNPRYVIYPAYMINGMWRLNGTFTEASAMAGHLSVGIALCAWELVTRPFRWATLLSFGLLTVALLLTISTAGYLSLILIMVVAVGLSIRGFIRTQSFSHAKAILLLLVLSGGVATFVGTNAAATVEKVFNSVFIEKQSSSSYRERTASNESALQASGRTYYLGTGWGSLRCSSLGSGLLGTVGIPGVFLFCGFLISLLTPLFGRHTANRDDGLYGKSLYSVFVILAAMMISSNEPVQPILWILFAACAAGPNVVRVWNRDGLRPRQLEPSRMIEAQSL